MGTHTDTMQSPLVSSSEASVSPCITRNGRLWGARCSIVPLVPALRAFADGFVGSLAGGLVYCMILAYFDSRDLQIAGMRVLALSLTFGGFEVWRVQRIRTRRDVTRCMLFTLSASLLVLWALGEASAGAERSPGMKSPPPPVQAHLTYLV
jgi:hypothetical protein